jgi:rhodanese-related sulfurtransferase
MKSAHDLVSDAKTLIEEVDLHAADAAIRTADVLIDVREADEYQAGHIPGAVNIPRGLLEFKLSNDPTLTRRDLNLVLHCKNSGRSALAACALQDMGYSHVLSIAGGYEAWHAAGKPVQPRNCPRLISIRRLG